MAAAAVRRAGRSLSRASSTVQRPAWVETLTAETPAGAVAYGDGEGAQALFQFLVDQGVVVRADLFQEGEEPPGIGHGVAGEGCEVGEGQSRGEFGRGEAGQEDAAHGGRVRGERVPG